MAENPARPRGRPITNKIERIQASPEKIAKALFKAADKKIKNPKPKPN